MSIDDVPFASEQNCRSHSAHVHHHCRFLAGLVTDSNSMSAVLSAGAPCHTSSVWAVLGLRLRAAAMLVLRCTMTLDVSADGLS